jgi:uncharacterized protein (TIGR02996 family)
MSKSPGALAGEGLGLLRGICEFPFDDRRRLVLTDWLEENDRPAQAEYVRTALELHKALPPIRAAVVAELEAEEGYGSWHARYVGGLPTDRFLWWLLDERPEQYEKVKPLADAYLDLFDKEFLYPFIGDNWRDTRFTFERGLVARVAIRAKLLTAHAAELFGILPITDVALYHAKTRIGGHGELLDGSLTRRGWRTGRLPGPIFAHLDKVGMPVSIRGASVTFPDDVDDYELVSRACVAYGREQAGLPPLEWAAPTAPTT